MLKNIGFLIKEVKKHLEEYLNEHGIDTSKRLFKCPNYKAHRHGDAKPSCNFYPNKTTFHCFACFIGDTLVYTSNGYKPIKYILPGERVLTHTGRFQPVTHIMRRPSPQAMYKIYTRTPEYMFVTPEHPFYIISREQVTHYFRDYTPSFVKASELKPGDWVLIPIIHPKHRISHIHLEPSFDLPLNRRVLLLLGLFIAEGYANKYEVRFTINKSETHLRYFIIKTLTKYFRVTPQWRTNSDNSCVIYFNLSEQPCLHNLFNSFYNEKKEKVIPPELFNNLSSKDAKYLIYGWLIGDGHITKHEGIVGCTTSQVLAHQIYYLAVRSYLLPIGHRRTNYHRLKGHKIRGKDAFYIRIRRVSKLKKVKKYTSSLEGRSITNTFYFKFQDIEYYAVPIYDIKKIKSPSKYVYNLEVSGDNSYVAVNVAVHNCSYKSGDIFDAVHLLEGKDITGENFIEVLKYLCDKYNIPYEETTTEEEKFYNECREFLNRLVDIAHQNLLKELKNNKKLEDFLRSKHWYESIEHFKLGYFSKTPVLQVNREVLSYLNIKNMTSLVNRVVIPIYNYNGNIAGITLRNLSDSGPKYIHYLMYNVRNLLFNIHNINSNEIYVVEGPSSVITLHSFGINNVVATFGNHFHEKQYELLVKKKISKLTLLYDGDSGGLEGTRNSLETISRYDIDAYIAFLPDKLDPGDYVIQNGDLSNINTKPLIDYLTEQYKLNTSDKYIERCLMTYISSITDLVKKEETINLVSKQTKINKSTLTDLLDLYSKKLDSISISELLKERESLLVTLNEYEKWTWSRGQLLGLKSYKSFDNKLDGIQNGLILVGGVPNVGKSALLLSLLVKLITLNENVYAIYFTVDDPLYVTISRLIANISNLPINIVSNPNFKIIKANLPEEVKKDYIARREKALEFLRGKTAILNIKDSSEGSTIEAIVEKVKNIHPLAEHKQLIIFIDNLHNLRSEKYVSDRHLYSLISSELNNLSNMYKCPIIASTHVTKESMRRGEVDNTAIKETVELIYDAKLIMFLHSEEDLEESEVRDDIDIDIIISKNKFSAFKGKIPFRFYRSISKIEEVDANSESNELFT